jgi:hypothetical protein
VSFNVEMNRVRVAPFSPHKGGLIAPVKRRSPHGEDAGALSKRPIRRSFANLLPRIGAQMPRIGAQNANSKWIIRDSQGPARFGLLAPG